MNAKQFSLKIEEIKRNNGDMTYMDAILHYCDKNKIDPAEVGKYISKSLKEALSILENLQNICESKKPEKIMEKISDEDVGVISSYGLIDFQLIRNTFSKYEVNLANEVKEKIA